MNQIVEPCESIINTTPEFPMGWFSVAKSRDLQVGEVTRVFAFDRELALYRTRNGVAVIQDAFCPHLGAHLGVNGKVVGESLQCPFHGWRFDAKGDCVEIPYCDAIPDRAKLRIWDSVEKNGEIYMWFHPQNTAPQFELPDFPELEDPNWTSPRYHEIKIPASMQDIAENTCDPVHFRYVHRQPDTPPSEVTVDEDGRTLHLRADVDVGGGVISKLHSKVFQMGLAFVRNVYGPNAEMVVYNSAQPIDRETTLLRWTLTVRREIEDLAGDNVMTGIIEGIQQDMPIWENKVHKRKPIFCREDQDLVLFRKWARQFYLPEAGGTGS